MTEEKPPKRRMSSFGPEEPSIRSLKTELEFMQKRQVATAREHCIIHNRYTKNMEKAEKENRALKKARFEIGEKLQRTEDARSILALEVEHRNEELKRLRSIEKRAEELGGWQKARHAQAATTDMNVKDVPEILECDLGVPRCCGAFTPSTRVVSRRGDRGWFLF